jgi:Trk K+ transport system NAD-binding subunit
MEAAAGWTGHVVVCGLGGVGVRTVEQFRAAGVDVVVVDEAPDRRAEATIDALGVPLVRSSARRAGGLEAAGLAGAVAVVCTERNELHTLEVALLVRSLRPDVRVVAQFANPGVGRALEEATGAVVLQVAALAAPAFVEASLARTTHDLDLGGTHFQVRRVTVEGPPTTFRAAFGDRSPLAVTSPDGTVLVAPGRDQALRPGDVVTLAGPPESEEDPEPPARDLVARAAAVARSVYRSDRALVLTIVGLLVLALVATVVLRLNYRGPGGRHLSGLDAFYFSVETMATVGFGDFSFARQAAWLELFGIGVIVLGLALVTTGFALMTNLLVTRRLEQELGSRHVPGMRGHVVVVGLGSVGLRVVEILRAQGRRVVVVDRDPGNRYLGQVRALGVPVVLADATQRQTLVSANVAQARAVAVVTSDDFANIEAGLAVRNYARVPMVLRVFDRQLEETLERHLGFEAVRSTADLAAPWFVGAALGLWVLGTFYVERLPLLVATFTVAAGGALEGLAMTELSGLRVVALDRHGQVEEPRRDARLSAGDQAYVIGPYEELLGLLRRQA